MDAVAVGGDLEVEVREVVLPQILGELESSLQRAGGVAVDVHAQQRLVLVAAGEVGGVVIDEVPDNGGLRELADPPSPGPGEVGADLVLEVDGLRYWLAGFLIGQLPAPVDKGDPLVDPLGSGSYLLLFVLGQFPVGFREDVAAPSLRLFLRMPVRRQPTCVRDLCLHLPPQKERRLRFPCLWRRTRGSRLVCLACSRSPPL